MIGQTMKREKTTSRPKPDRARPRRRLAAADRRAVILAGAKRLFAGRGYAATSIDDIAAASGVSKPVVYDHFDSKRALYFAVMRGLRDELVRGATEKLAGGKGAPQKLAAAITHYYRQVQRDPAIVEILFVQPRTEPDLAKEWQRLQDEALASLRPLARELVPALAPWKLQVALHLLHHGLNATAAAWPENASAEDMAELVTSMLWSGLKSLR
jgi:AcrR family transcriptional regulator